MPSQVLKGHPLNQAYPLSSFGNQVSGSSPVSVYTLRKVLNTHPSGFKGWTPIRSRWGMLVISNYYSPQFTIQFSESCMTSNSIISTFDNTYSLLGLGIVIMLHVSCQLILVISLSHILIYSMYCVL